MIVSEVKTFERLCKNHKIHVALFVRGNSPLKMRINLNIKMIYVLFEKLSQKDFVTRQLCITVSNFPNSPSCLDEAMDTRKTSSVA